MSLEVGQVDFGRESDIGGDYVRRYLNARVRVYYMNSSGVFDDGRITYIDAHWVELTKDNGERLLAPVAGIRIIKVPKQGQIEGDASVLLRAADVRRQIESE